jgi:hypothetical protein
MNAAYYVAPKQVEHRTIPQPCTGKHGSSQLRIQIICARSAASIRAGTTFYDIFFSIARMRLCYHPG